MVKRVLNSVIANYHDLSMSRRSIVYLNLQLWQTIDLFAIDKLQYYICLISFINAVNYFQYWKFKW